MQIDALQSIRRSRTRGFGRLSAAHTVRSILAAIVLLLVYSAWFSPAVAGELRAVQELASIRAAAEEFVRNAAPPTTGLVNVTAAELDARLRFPACEGPLQAFGLHGAGVGTRNTVGVRCSIGAEWTLYVAVNVTTDVDVLVLQTAAARDARLTQADVIVQRRRVPGFGGLYVSDMRMLEQQRLKRSLSAGTALAVEMLTRDLLVKRGQQVSLVSSINGIEVRAPGLALADGGNADRIRVQNASSLKIMEGTIESGNLVRVGM